MAIRGNQAPFVVYGALTQPTRRSARELRAKGYGLTLPFALPLKVLECSLATGTLTQLVNILGLNVSTRAFFNRDSPRSPLTNPHLTVFLATASIAEDSENTLAEDSPLPAHAEERIRSTPPGPPKAAEGAASYRRRTYSAKEAARARGPMWGGPTARLQTLVCASSTNSRPPSGNPP